MKWLSQNWIAVLALLISALSFFYNYLRPSRINVRNTGRVTFGQSLQNYLEPCISLNLIFINKGSIKGVVKTVAIVLDIKGKKNYLFPTYFNEDRTIHMEKTLQAPKIEPFHSFDVDKSESVLKDIGFTPRHGDTLIFETGIYKVDIFIQTSRNNKWRKVNSLSFEVNGDDLAALKPKITPQPDGRSYVEMSTRTKETIEVDEELKRLKN